MGKIVLDSSTIISCAINCLMWVFEPLKGRGNVFIVPPGVKKEVIDEGLTSQKYKYEAIRVLRYFQKKIIEVDKTDIKTETNKILSYANSSFTIKGNPLKILQNADAEVAALAKKIGATAIATDERTLRMLIENPDGMTKILGDKFHAKVNVNENSLNELKTMIGGLEVLRSAEIMAVAFMEDLFEETTRYCEGAIPNCKKELILGILFALKFSGCAIAFDEVKNYANVIVGGN